MGLSELEAQAAQREKIRRRLWFVFWLIVAFDVAMIGILFLRHHG